MEEMKICTGCGAKLKQGQKFCSSCGKVSEAVAGTEARTIGENERQAREAAREYLEKQNSLSNNYFLGFLGALIGGLVGAIPWAIISSLGWFVAWAGFLIAIAASKGYDMMKVKMSMNKLWFVAVAVIVGVFAGMIMSDLLSIAFDWELNKEFGYWVGYYFNNFGEMLMHNIPNLMLGLIFATLGGLRVIIDIRRESSTAKNLKAKYPEFTDITEM